MKIVSIHGSPRPNGNSTSLANRILVAAEQRGAEVQRVELNELDYQGCQACYACKQGSETCVLNDNLAAVHPFAVGPRKQPHRASVCIARLNSTELEALSASW